tara:strand:+ start:414 stop:740 length:327 start_codon:yes stop_codon:yes gene_type:complete
MHFKRLNFTPIEKALISSLKDLRPIRDEYHQEYPHQERNLDDPKYIKESNRIADEVWNIVVDGIAEAIGNTRSEFNPDLFIKECTYRLPENDWIFWDDEAVEGEWDDE